MKWLDWDWTANEQRRYEYNTRSVEHLSRNGKEIKWLEKELKRNDFTSLEKEGKRTEFTSLEKEGKRTEFKRTENEIYMMKAGEMDR